MLKKTIIVTALVTSSVFAGSAFATGLQTLINKNNTSNSYLTIANSSTGICSTTLGNSGIADPGSTITSSKTQINAVCMGSYPCKTTTYAFTKKPSRGLFCKGGTPVATTTLTESGQVTFNSLNGDFPTTFKGSTSGTAKVGTQINPDANGTIEIYTSGN